MQMYNQIYTLRWVMYRTVHCDKQKMNINTQKQQIMQNAI